MKRFIQLIIFLFIILFSYICYKIYFKESSVKISKIETPNKEIKKQSENNLIKNLKYEAKLNENNKYIITADLSEIVYENNIELIKMQKVIAKFIDENGIPLIIISDNALYNNSNYNTDFYNNIKISYLDDTIFSDQMRLDFQNNMITIYGNVKYDGLQGLITTDNIKINLLTKKIDIYMNNSDKKVQVTTK